MIRRALAAVVVSLALAAVPAAAWDPDFDDEWSEPEPVYEPPDAPEREAPEPVERRELPEREAPEPVERPDPPERETAEPAHERPDPPERAAPIIEVPEGVHYVTETYTGDLVSRAGPTTTYSTATVDMSPGTYARAVDSVPTGSASPYDGSAFNGRTRMGDGRAVAGTYYENFILTGGGFVSVSIVFFQDDQETAVASPPAPLPPSPPPPPPSFPPIVSNLPVAVPVTLPAVTAPTVVIAPAAATAPIIDEERALVPATSTPTLAPPSTAGATGNSPMVPGAGPGGAPRTPVLRVGIAPAPQADMLATLEVMRGRRVSLWARATIDGAPATVREWRASGELTSLGPLSGTGDEPLVARWDSLATPGSAWPVRFEMTVDVPGIGPSRADAVLSVTVRSPALIR